MQKMYLYMQKNKEHNTKNTNINGYMVKNCLKKL